MTGLHVDSVIKHFGDQVLLNDIFISCQQGEIIGLLGRNGSGKSSLLQIIFGSLPAENRFVTIDDQKLDTLPAKANLLAYLPQQNFLPSHLRIKTIISLFCNLHKAELLKAQHLVMPLLDKKSKSLSGGERRMIEILLLVYSEAKYLLFDEPFNGIAPLHIDLIKAIIREHSAQKGFIITDHDYRNILEISTSVMLLKDGKTRKINDPQELVELGYLPASAMPAS